MPFHHTPPSYKLIYFDMKGRAEVSRLLFHAAGVAFEDVRLTKEQFAEKKQSFLFEQVPILEVNGTAYSQSLGIAQFLAREFGFFGKTNVDGLKIDQVFYHVADMFAMVSKTFAEPDEAKRGELMKEVIGVKLPKALELLVKLLKSNDSGFFFGSKMSLADISLFDFCTAMAEHQVVTIEKCPEEIRKLIDKVSKYPKLVKYLSERK